MSSASKRPFESNTSHPNVRGKWRKTAVSASQQTPSKVPTGAVVFRVLCPISKSGSVIGKGGGVISRIRLETGAKVKLEEIIPGCEERVIIITGSEKYADVSNEHPKEGDEKADAADVSNEHPKEGDKKADAADVSNEYPKEGDEKADVADGAQDDKVSGENNEEKEDSSVSEACKSEKAPSSAQKALLLVFERIIEEEAEEVDGDEDEGSKESTVSVRLLIASSQVGCLLGKGGSVIKQMISDSAAQIRVLARDKIPACASAHDEIVQITGGNDSAKKALQLVSQLLIENPPRGSFPATKAPGPLSRPFAPIPRTEARPPVLYPPPQVPPFSNRPYNAADISPFPMFHDGVGPGHIQGPPEQLIFRLLCSNDKVGSVIGKGGSIIKSLQHETGSEIKVLETTPETDDRIIVICSPPFPVDRISPAQDAVVRVQQRIAMAVPDSNENVSSRLLVSAHQIGCLLGKGGAIITEMRKRSGAQIRILIKEQIPKSVVDSDEVVQVTGELRAVQDALLQITDKLKNQLFRERVPAMNRGGHPNFLDQMPPFGTYIGRREPSPLRMFSNLPPFQKEIVGRPHEERSTFAHAIHGPGVPHGLERIPPAPWGPQAMREGAGGSMLMPDYPGGAPQRRIGGFAGGNHPTVITSTTVDVVVPRALVPLIYGEDGSCLRRIREVSEAKITITEPRPEATETVIIICGTPEQTHAAQSLIQAFVLSETGAA